jgi:CSLREA domain-containing protein
MPRAFSVYSRIPRTLSLTILAGLITLAAQSAGVFNSLMPRARAATAFTVNSTGDGADSNTSDNVCDDGTGHCTLRAAIQQANATAGADTINFQIGSGAQTITPATDLPIITDTVVIDGTTQPGFSGSPLIEINGTNAHNRAGLTIQTSDSTIRGLVLNRFNTGAINLASGGNNHVEGNYVGTDVTGMQPMGGGGVGVGSSGNVIGGLTAASRNVISGTSGTGVGLGGASATGNVIEGNYIGLNASGTSAIPNNTQGVSIGGAVGNTIGGTTPGAGNVISGNGMCGIEVTGQMTTIQGNLIGTNAAGTAAVRNGDCGIRIFNSPNNTVGGTAAGAGNLISGNFAAGLSIEEGGSKGNVVQGNLIGTDINGTSPLPNSPEGFGVPNTTGGVFFKGASGNTIGGAAPGAGNTIAYNGGAGIRDTVTVPGPTGDKNSFSRNSIFGNLGLGIDIGANGVTANDAGDADGFQNFPVVTPGAPDGAGGTTVGGTISAKPVTAYTIEFFANRGCHQSGNGEGARFFGSLSVITDANGNASFSSSVNSPLAAGQVLTATATDPLGNTSEFSPCTSSGPTGAPGATGIAQFAATGFRIRSDLGTLNIPVVRVGGSSGALAVNFATRDDTAIAGQHYTAVSGTLNFADGETAKNISLPITKFPGSGSRTLFVTLTNTSTPEVVGASGVTVVRIFGSNSGPTISFGGTSVREGDAGTTNAVIPVGLSIAIGQTVTVDYSTLAMTATSGVDFQPVSGTLTFAPGETLKSVTVPVIGDRLNEFNETFTLSLSNETNAFIDFSSNPPVTTILDDDAPPSVSVSDAGLVEPASGTATAVFNVGLSYPSGKVVTVNFATADGTAKAGSDYQAASGTLAFAPGETTKTVSVVVNSDAEAEPVETFALNLSNPSNVSLARAQGTGTIAPANSSAVQFSAASYSARESDHSAAINVTRAGDTSASASVDYATADLTATERADYTKALGTLRFAPGESSKTFVVLLSEDAYAEGDETVTLTLTNPVGAFVNGPNTASLVIHDEGASAVNPADVAQSFVRQHYHDFLNREPDDAGLQFWTSGITGCGSDANCTAVKRINTSAAFFLSIEFQETGYLVERIYKTAYGDSTGNSTFPVQHVIAAPVVRLDEFLLDTQRIGQGVVVGVGNWQQQLEDNKNAFALEFVSRQRFAGAFPTTMTADDFVSKLDQNAGGVLSPDERAQLSASLSAAPADPSKRAAALRQVAENANLRQRESNRAFVLMQYFGYLRRNPNDAPDADYTGYDFWLTKLNQFNGDFVKAEMVKAFITSAEYRGRFGQ